MLLAIAIVAQIMAVAALVMRKGWRTVRVLFWAEMIQAGMFAGYYLLPKGSWAAYYFWHDSNKISILICYALFATYARAKQPALVVIALTALLLGFVNLGMYADLDLEWKMSAGGWLYLSRGYASIFFDLCVAWATYTNRVGNPHKEKTWPQTSR